VNFEFYLNVGSGKGTQCDRIIKKYGFTHLSAGDLIRAAVQDSNSAKGRYFNEMMSQGKLISTVRLTSFGNLDYDLCIRL